jgi:2-oxoglutarate ferredoxin oxidoreductase subunit gamma
LQNQSYGSESRGGETRGDVIISGGDIYDLEPTKYDLLVAMTQPGYDKFIPSLKPGGTLIIDKDLVVADSKDEPENISKHALSATDIASIHLVSESALSKAIEKNVPSGTEELNLNAMQEGIALAEQELEKS